MKAPRIYLDTSIFGGCFDREFQRESNRVLELVRDGRIVALVSEIVLGEIDPAPSQVKRCFEGLPESCMQRIEVTDAVESLVERYFQTGAIGVRARADATHVAAATVARADAIASWNFKDIVRFDRIRVFNSVNQMLGYDYIAIVSPQGVCFDEGT